MFKRAALFFLLIFPFAALAFTPANSTSPNGWIRNGNVYATCTVAAQSIPGYVAGSVYEYGATCQAYYDPYTYGAKPIIAYLNCPSGYYLSGTTCAASICPAGSSGTYPTCTCNTGLVVNATLTACEAPTITPAQQASNEAIAAAAAAGRNVAEQAAAGAAAADAITAGHTTANAALAGSTAATAMSVGANAVTASAAGALVANLRQSGNSQTVSVDTALMMSGASTANRLAAAASGLTWSDAIAGTALALGGGAIASALTGGALVQTAMLASASFHAGLMAVVTSGAPTSGQNAAASAGSAAIKSGAAPLQVSIVAQSVGSVVTDTVTAPASTAAQSAALVAVQTLPQSSWEIPATLPTNTATVAAKAAIVAVNAGQSSTAAQAAAQAAANTTASGGSIVASQTAGSAAGQYVASGGTGVGAAIAGAQAGQAAQGASEATLRQIRDQHNLAPIGDIPAAEAIGQHNVNIGYSPITFTAVSGCPAPVTFTMFGQLYSFNFDIYCQFFSNVRPVIIAVALATAAFIMMSAFA